MNIITIHSSPRKNGITSTILSEIEKNIGSEHCIETFNVNNLNFKPCTGCLKCRPNSVCVLPRDDAHKFYDKLTTSNLIIVASPVYWGNIPGPLKTLFDRCVTAFESIESGPKTKLPEKRLTGKKAILIFSSGAPYPYNLLSSQSGGAVRSIKTIFRSGGIKIAKIMNISNSYNFEKRKSFYINRAKSIGLSI